MMDKRTHFKSLARRFFYLNKRIFSFGNIGLLERRQTFYERYPKRCRFRLIEKMGVVEFRKLRNRKVDERLSGKMDL